MTGYGRYQETVSGMDITVEIKSVNHRYFEFSARMSRAYSFLEEKLKTYLQSRIARGKVDVNIWIDAVDRAGVAVAVNHPLAKAYLTAGSELEAVYGLKNDLTVRSLAQFPDVMAVRKVAPDEQEIWNAVAAVTEGAVKRLVEMREREGANLRADILTRRELILAGVTFVEERSPQTVAEHMEKVTTRMRELLDTVTVDESRLLTEAAVFADRLAVAEETVRLRSHMDQLASLLNTGEAVGRKLDFLLQEINREINTIGSKSQDVSIARVVVDIKAEIEKIREQIQNIE